MCGIKILALFLVLNFSSFYPGAAIETNDLSYPLPEDESLDFSDNFYNFNGTARLPRINGGRVAFPNEFPYQAAVMTRVKNNPVFVFVCGAAIHSRSYIVTAGHCLHDKDVRVDPKDLRVVVGQRDVRLYIREGSPELMQVNQTVTHPGFKTEGLYFVVNDIGLIKLSTPLNYSSSVKKLRVALPTEGPSNGVGTVSGYGRTEIYLPDGRPISGQASTLPVALPLRTAQLRIVPRQICSIRHFTIVPETILCVGSEGILNSESACYGDSGGPLVCPGASGPFLCGLVSTGTGCGLRFTPAFYTDVSKFSTWIRGIAGPQ